MNTALIIMLNICFHKTKKLCLCLLITFLSTGTYSFEVRVNGVGGIFIKYQSIHGDYYAINIDPAQINVNTVHEICSAQEDEGDELIISANTDAGIKTFIFDKTSRQITTFE